jgi:hypothetical protein
MRAIDSPQICEIYNYNFNQLTTQKSRSRSALTLLVTRISTDHAHNAVAPNDFAIAADPLYRCQHFHV